METKFKSGGTGGIISLLTIVTILIITALATSKLPERTTSATPTPALAPSSTTAPISITPTSDKFYAPVLMYHHISKTMSAGPYVVRPETFEKQMAWIKDNNYQVITYSQFYDALTNKKILPEKSVVITFDDNNKDQYENALPILKKYNYKAIFFIPTAYINKRGGVMTWDMLKDLVKEGMEIGSHSSTHPNLTVIPKKQLYDEELIGSKRILEENLKIPIIFFAYPGGAKSNSVVAAAKEAGYLSAVTTHYDAYHLYSEDPLRVSRIYVDNNMKNFADFIVGKNIYKMH